IYVWDSSTRQPILDTPSVYLANMAFSPVNHQLAVGSDGRLDVWDMDTTHTVFHQSLEAGHRASGVAFSPDGATLAVAGGFRDASLRLVDVATGQFKGDPIVSETDAASSVCFSEDGKLLAFVGRNGINLVDVASGQVTGAPLMAPGSAFSRFIV